MWHKASTSPQFIPQWKIHEVDIINIISQMRKLNLRELKFLAQVKELVSVLEEVSSSLTGHDSWVGLCLGWNQHDLLGGMQWEPIPLPSPNLILCCVSGSMGWERRENLGMGTEVLLRTHLLPSLPTSSKTQVALGLMQQYCSTGVQRAISDMYLLPMPPECLRTPTLGTVCIPPENENIRNASGAKDYISSSKAKY